MKRINKAILKSIQYLDKQNQKLDDILMKMYIFICSND